MAEPETPEGYTYHYGHQSWICLRCGVMVADSGPHNNFHQRITSLYRSTLGQADPGPFVTKSGKVISEEEIAEWVREAEAGYFEKLARKVERQHVVGYLRSLAVDYTGLAANQVLLLAALQIEKGQHL
jgi:hypothetical protein